MSVVDRVREDRRLLSLVATVALAVVVLGYTQLVLPGTGGGRGTPGAILFNGLVYGLLNSLLAAGLILVYRTTRIINFAQTAIGSVGGALTFLLMQLNGVPFLFAFPLGLLLAGVVGLAFDVVIVRRFFRSARIVLTVATIAVAGYISGAGTQTVANLPFFPQDIPLEQALGTASIRRDLPFPGWSFQIGDLRLRFGFPEVFAIEVTLLALLGLALFFRYTRAGVAVRAMAENSERATLLGISVGTLSSIVWVITGVLGGIGVIMTGALTSPSAAQGVAPAILLPALVAAVVARMQSIPVATAVSVAIAVVTQATSWSYRRDTGLVAVALVVVLSVGLLLQRRTLLRSDAGGAGGAWEATEEQRPVPTELRGIGGVRLARWALMAVLLAAAVSYPFLFSTGATVLGGVILLTGIVVVSLVVLTGWAGQASLGQFGLMALGGVTAGGITGAAGWSFWLAVPAAIAVTAAMAVLIGLPALRIKGLFLAAATFAFAVAVSAALFNPRYFDWLLPDEVERPSLYFLDFEDERTMYFLCLVAFLLAVAAVVNLRRSRFGRILIGLRENEANLQSFGIDVVRTKLLAFAASGALAGFAGAIYVHHQRGISAASFEPQASVDVFLMAVIGGVSSVPGALLGAAYFTAGTYWWSGNLLWESFKPLSVILVLWVLPGGLIAGLNLVRDSVLRIVAQRRQLIVPSLFADVDPDALARRRVPLSTPLTTGGLAALPPGTRYALESELYAGPGQRIGDAEPSTPTREAAAIGAAAEAATVAEVRADG